MKLKILFLLMCGISLLSFTQVFALGNDTVYVNSNGVELTEKELHFVNEFYGEDFFETMTHEDYVWISDLDINNRDVEIKTISDYSLNNGMMKSPSYSTNSKKLSISKACSSNVCTIITNLNWFTNPTIRSYDLIGVRFYNTSLNNNIVTTKVTSSKGTEYSSNNKFLANGFGTSVKLPTDATNISVQQKLFTQPGGIVYASYQHAVRDISLQTSLNYTMGVGGYGNVFLFYGGVDNYYDAMGGVNIDL